MTSESFFSGLRFLTGKEGTSTGGGCCRRTRLMELAASAPALTRASSMFSANAMSRWVNQHMLKLMHSLNVSQVEFLNLTIWKRHIQVVRVHGYEADDVVATLTEQVLQKGYRVVIASPDKDFKQLISDDVQLVMPIPEIGRWSFYTLRHYVAQYKCDPTADLSLREYISLVSIHDLFCKRWESLIFEQLMNWKLCCTGCFMGDEADGVPGIQHLVPGFGRKTAVKLLQKHGSLKNLLNTAAIRTVGKDYAQDALTKHADYLRKNYEILSLKRYEISIMQKDQCFMFYTHALFSVIIF